MTVTHGDFHSSHPVIVTPRKGSFTCTSPPRRKTKGTLAAVFCSALALTATITTTIGTAGTATAADTTAATTPAETTTVTATTASEDLDPTTFLNTALSPDPNALIHTYTDEYGRTIATYDQPAYPFMWNIENQYRGTGNTYEELTKDQAQEALDYIFGPTAPNITTTMEWDGEAPTTESPTGQPRVTFRLSNLNPGKEYTLTAHIPQLRNTDLDQLYADNPGIEMISDPATSGGYSSGTFPAAPKLGISFIPSTDTATITATLPSSTLTPGTPYHLYTVLYEGDNSYGMSADSYKEFRTPLSPEEVTEIFTNSSDYTEVDGDGQIDAKTANLSYDAANTKITMFAAGDYAPKLEIYEYATFTTSAPHKLLTQKEASNFGEDRTPSTLIRFNNLNMGCGSGASLGTYNMTGMCVPTTWSTMPVTVTPDKPSETTKPSEPSEPATSEPESSKPSEPESSAPESSEPSEEPSENPSEEPETSEPSDTVKPSEPSSDKPAKEGDIIIQVVNNATNITTIKNGLTITKISEPHNPTVIVVTQDDTGKVISTHCEDSAGNIVPGSEKKPGDKGFEESVPADKMPENLKPQQATPAEENKANSRKATSTVKDKDKAADKPKAKASSDNDNKPNKAQERATKPVGPRVITGGTLTA